ncbi:MAG: hypothetical protein IRZ31_10630 [Thermogemmatispora sp.]|uniref:hypothetical protein n=1 Tax=Thermogemmatispora sp. TaxID=1968838 RepID=UPI00260FA8D0|nr:hypothetical protein [Thermogemmatispora sp.]MBX5457344.1 hypothetical protein [Thermogemmatispora sp.]
MLAPDQGMIPDASVFARVEGDEPATCQPVSMTSEEAGQSLACEEEKAEPVFAGSLWETGEACEGEIALEPEWIEQVCCHIEAISAGAGERA